MTLTALKRILTVKTGTTGSQNVGVSSLDDTLDDFVKDYAKKINGNKPWGWDDLPGAENLNAAQRKLIKQRAIENGYIPDVPTKPGTNFSDFKAADVIYKINGEPVIKKLPQDMWKMSDKNQFEWLDAQLPGGKRPTGYVWHHSEVSGQMELVPFGIHNSTYHVDGRAPGGWADSKR